MGEDRWLQGGHPVGSHAWISVPVLVGMCSPRSRSVWILTRSGRTRTTWSRPDWRGGGAAMEVGYLGRMLFEAARKGDLFAVQRAVEGGADVNSPDEEGRTVLVEAAGNGHLNIVKYFVEHGADVNATDTDGRIAMSLAAANCYWDIVKYLIEHGADVNAKDNDGQTCLNHAATCGHVGTVMCLIEHGADVNAADNNRRTALIRAAANCHYDSVKYLVEHGADVNFADKDGRTALSWVARHGHLEIVKYVVERGADVNVKDKDGRSALIWAAEEGLLDTVKCLVELGANVNTMDNDERTPLSRAAAKCRLGTMKYLIEHGADTNAIDKERHTALSLAAAAGHLEIVKYLVEHGADVSATDNARRMPLSFAAEYGHLDTVKYLVEHGADVNATGYDRKTAISLAASNGHMDTVKYLVEHGADVNARGYNRETAISLAASNGHMDIVKCLVEHGADVNARGYNRETAISLAASNGHVDTVKYLVEHGADVNATGYDGRTAISLAASNGHMDIVKYLVEHGADVNATGYDRKTATSLAASNGHMDIVKYLVEHKADVNVADKDGCTALSWAGQRCEWDTVKFLIEHRALVKGNTTNEQTTIRQAASAGHLDIVQYFTEHGADVNAIDNDGRTAISLAASNGHMDIVKYLVEHKADVNVADKDGCTALSWAGQRCEWDTVKFLIEHRALVKGNTTNEQTTIRQAASAGHLDIVQYFTEHGADVNAVDNDGRTAISSAASNGHMDIVKYLVEHGADVNITDNDGQTALICAAANGQLEIVRYLSDRGSGVNAIDHYGRTPLVRAAANGRLEVVKYLVDSGADVKIVDSSGFSAATVAARHGHNQIHRMLTLHGSGSAVPSTDHINFITSNLLASSRSELLTSPFDLDVTKATDSNNTAADFVATWLDAPVALKLFVLDSTDKTFYDEVTLWHQLRHPNVLKLYGACDVGHFLFVCELASKGSVVEYLQSCLPEHRRPWRYLHHAALGLAYLHERGIIHGDLRGSNILMGDDDQAKLANFGLSGSSTRGHKTSSSSRVYADAMRWKSPELLNGEKPSEASDVYALGLCIVEMLTGMIPWCGKEMVFHKQRWKPESEDPKMFQPAPVSEECENLLSQLCCQDPTQRVSASACVQLLERLVQQENSSDQILGKQQFDQNACESWHSELSKLWTKIQEVFGCDNQATPKLYRYQSVIDDLTELYDTIKDTPQPLYLMEQFFYLLQDAISLIENTSHAALIIHLSSTRATKNSVYALRRRIADIKKQLGLGKHNDIDRREAQNEQITTNDVSDPYYANETQIFISEVSNTWLILDDLETSEERAAFLSYLEAEISRHGANYSDDQREIMRKAYDDLKSKLDANEDFSTNLPVWFVPWYELTFTHGKHIGSGGFGSVHLAKWLNSDVVVKRLELKESVDGAKKPFSSWTLSSTPSSTPQTKSSNRVQKSAVDRDLFQREVNIWFNLSHPHVVRLFGACHVGREPFFVCEYASNGSLDKYLAKHPDEIWKKLHEAALGLLYLHERGIVHCDLKCNNIVVGSDKKAKVTDFGLSLAASTDDDGGAKDKSGNVTGAWNWLSPELMLGYSTSPNFESDVFSFGMCIVEALRVVASATAEVEERVQKRPRVPWYCVDEKLAVKALMKRGKHLPDRPVKSTDAQWELVEKMCKFNPRERIKMCTVVDELAVLVETHQQLEQHSSEKPTSTSSHTEVAAVSALRSCIDDRRITERDLGSLDRINRIYQLLRPRVEDIQTRVGGDMNAKNRLDKFTTNAQAWSKAISDHSDSLVDFTKLALQAYGLHRRLDKLMAAASVKIGDSEHEDKCGSNVHDWKRRCYEILGVEPSVALPLLFRANGHRSSQETSAA